MRVRVRLRVSVRVRVRVRLRVSVRVRVRVGVRDGRLQCGVSRRVVRKRGRPHLVGVRARARGLLGLGG